MKVRGFLAALAAFAVMGLVVGCAGKTSKSQGEENKTEGSGKTEAKPDAGGEAEAKPTADASKVKDYALEGCLFSGKPTKDSTAIVHEGQTLKFCCGDCKGKFEGDTVAGMKKYEEKVAAK